MDEVLHLWSGLGYYARARNLQRAAQPIVTQHGRRVPDDARGGHGAAGHRPLDRGRDPRPVRGERIPILDGNVKRVLTRYFGVEG